MFKSEYSFQLYDGLIKFSLNNDRNGNSLTTFDLLFVDDTQNCICNKMFMSVEKFTPK